MQVTIANSNGTTHQMTQENLARELTGMKIGDTFEGSLLGLDEYELEITGGSDEDGFPMRKTVEGQERKTILASGGEGVNVNEKGKRVRKTVRGNTVSEEIQQLNTKITVEGDEDIEEVLE